MVSWLFIWKIEYIIFWSLLFVIHKIIIRLKFIIKVVLFFNQIISLIIKLSKSLKWMLKLVFLLNYILTSLIFLQSKVDNICNEQ